MSGKSMTMTDHLGELRKRLLVCLVLFLGAAIAAFSYSSMIADFLMDAAGEMKFVFLSPAELFMSYVKISLVAGLCVSLPLIIFQAWSFIAPGLSGREKASLALALFFGAVFFSVGAVFSFFVIVPITIKFFLSYSSARVEALISISDYFSFISGLVFSFGAAFELPIVAAALGGLGLIRAEMFEKGRRVAILGIFVAAAILTPPDVVSQVLLALPLLALFELSLLILKVQERGRAKRLAASGLSLESPEGA